jgi:hypothetical protein
MVLGDRLGLVGVILALLGIAFTYLWPDKKWIGWLSLSVAVLLIAMWGWLEFKLQFVAFYQSYPIKSTVLVFLCGGLLSSGLWLWVTARTPTEVAPDQTGPARPSSEPSVNVTAYLQPEAPYDVQILAGIMWQKQYVDVRLDLANGAIAIHNLDFVVGLDTSIAGIGQLSQFPGITAFPANTPLPAWLQGTDSKGNAVAIPLTPIPGTTSTAPVYRVHCSELFANTVVHLVIASIAINQPTAKGGMPQQLFAPRRAPEAIQIKGQYAVQEGSGLRTYPLEFSYQFPQHPGPARQAKPVEPQKPKPKPSAETHSAPTETLANSPQIQAAINKVLNFPNAVQDSTVPPTIIETLLTDQTPRKLFNVLMQYDEGGVSPTLRDFLRQYYQFEQNTGQFENELLEKIGGTVTVRFRQAWAIYLRYAILRFAGMSKDQVIAGGNFLNYGISWDDAENIYGQLSSDPLIAKKISTTLSQYAAFVELTKKLRASAQ